MYIVYISYIYIYIDIYIYIIYIYYIYIYIDYRVHVILGHLPYFMARKASYHTLLIMLFETILDDLLLYILLTSVVNFVGFVPLFL